VRAIPTRRGEIVRLKHELINDHFQNYKTYGIPKAQFEIKKGYFLEASKIISERKLAAEETEKYGIPITSLGKVNPTLFETLIEKE
jgi:hypothetical protein